MAIRRPLGAQRTLPWPGRTALPATDKGGLVDEAMLEGDLPQGFDHGDVAAAQRLRLQLVQPLAQLAEDLFQALEEAFAAGIHLLALHHPRLLRRECEAPQQKHRGAQQDRQQGHRPGVIESSAQTRYRVRHTRLPNVVDLFQV